MTTALQDWTAQIQGIVKGLLDEAELTGDFLEVEKEGIRSTLRTMAYLGRLCDVMPEACNCANDECCPGWQVGYSVGLEEGRKQGVDVRGLRRFGGEAIEGSR